MLKNSKLLIILLFLICCKSIFASTSSSFLISKSAFNNYDYNQVLFEYTNDKFEKFNSNYLNELISSVIIENLVLAKKISKQILKIDLYNQEAKLVSIVNSLKNNSKEEVNIYRFDNNKNKNNLFEFLFFKGDSLKNKKEVSNAFLEVVRASYSNKKPNNLHNYNFLLFYISLAILIDKDNFEAIYMKGQLLHIVENYLEAESTYLRIPKKSEFFLDAQRNIAFNYSKENGFKDLENKILKIINNNKKDYQLTKILADFYRIQKKYKKAIGIYTRLFEENHEDNWYIIYLRGICYEKSKEWKKAEIDFLKSLQLKPNSPNVLNYLAYGWIERGEKIDKSLEMLNEAYNSNPNSYYILDSLAWAYFKKKEYKKAADLMEQVIDMVPGEAISLDHLGDIYYAMNRKREAIYFWKQAMDLAEPEDEITEKIFQKLINNNAS